MSLTGSGRSLRGVRVAVVDTDPTRTDALAVALRARQAEVHVSHLEADRVHMRLLRKFSPHAVLIDEEVMSSVGRPFVEKLRGDPFLAHTQLFTLRFDRMYKPRVGVASIETVREFLEPLGRAENELLARLGPHVEVEFELDQFPPHRLLKMLATRPAPTTLQCTREKEMLRWTVVRGRTGHAQLYRLGVDEPERLSADEALEWLLGHKNSHVVLLQPTEFDDQTGRDIIPMVERQESGLWVMPGPSTPLPTTPNADSLSPIALRRRFSKKPSSEKGAARRAWQIPSWKLAAAVVLFGVLTGAVFRPSFLALSREPAAAAVPEPVHKENLAELGVETNVPSPTPKVEKSTSPGSVEAAPQPDPDPQAEPKEDNAGAVLATSSPLFRVPAAAEKRCEDLAGEMRVPSTIQSPAQVARLANQHFRAAQKALVGGQNEEAHAAMCRAALLDPAGAGTLLLVQFVLSRRDYEQALFWMKQVRDARPGELDVEELWGDVLHQAGREDEALQVWLTALSMQPDEVGKRTAVARRWASHAERSLSGGDYPRAERALRRAISFDPKLALVARQLSTVFARQGLDELSARWHEQEVRLVQGR